MIRAAGVVIPAHNEEELLPACLAAVRAAIECAGIETHLVVVADACDDRTAARALAGGATVIETGARSVGAARAAGMAEVLSRTAQLPPEQIWLATTDADTIVPPAWLRQHLRYAAIGWQAVVGTIAVGDWAEHPPEVPPLFLQRYASPDGEHAHVHGANLGFTAEAYLAAGGFAAIQTAEDHELVRALAAAGHLILRTAAVTVVTSARRHARAPRGFSHLLTGLATAAAGSAAS